MLEVTLLGCGGMLPMKNRWLTSCLVGCQGHSLLIDCGEGTQIAFKCAGRKVRPVDIICITHFHADHISGLPGFLLSLGNEGRTEPITIAGPPGIEKIVRSLCIIAPNLPFEINCMEIADPQPFRYGDFKISPFEVRHSIRCFGYSVELERKGRFIPEKARVNDVPMCIWSKLQKYGEVEYNGRRYNYSEVSEGSRKGIKLTYCTDTRPVKNIITHAENSDLFICEGLYYDPEKISRAVKTGHMLYSEAAKLAKESAVKQLWLTHFSPAVKDPEEGIEQARSIFPQSFCGTDGKSVDIDYPED